MKTATKAKLALTTSLFLILLGLVLGLALMGLSETASHVDPSPVADVEQEEKDPFPVVDWDYWQDRNPNVIGWVTVPGTVIDLPICQAPSSDPTYYLSHDVYGKWNFYGCPYLDAECAEKGLDSPLAMVFGHHMSDGSMFAEMASFSNDSFTDSHRLILLQTPERKYELTVVAIDIIDSYSEFKRLDFETQEDLEKWWLSTWEKSDVSRVCELAGLSSIKAFVTCSYGPWNGHERTVVYAIEGAE